MLQYVAVCCSVLQCAAVSCSVLHCVAVSRLYYLFSQGRLHAGANTCCSMLQYVTVCCSVLRCVAVFCTMLQCHDFTTTTYSVHGDCTEVPIRVAVCCSMLQYVAVCNIMQIVVVCHSILRCVAVINTVLQCILFLYVATTAEYRAASCVAVCCSLLQFVAVRCNVVQ